MKIKNQIDCLFSKVLKKIAPPEKLKVSEWAEKHRVLSAEGSAEVGRWKNNRTPYLVGIMDCANDRRIREIVIMSSSQVGKSECLNNMLGFSIDLDPAPMLMIQPTSQMAEDYSRDRIAPMIRDCTRLIDKVSNSKSRDTSNTILHKNFPGGHLTLAGSNSPAQLASRPIRDLYADEVDRCAVTSEGDSIAIAEKRTITFYNRKVIKVSSPRIKDLSRIERAYKRSDQRHYFVKCTECQHEQTFKWIQVRWDKDERGKHNAESAYYECEKCNHKIYDAERYKMISEGRWIASDPFNGVAGFHLNEMYSLFRKLKEIVQTFLDCKDNPETLQVFVNTSLGEPFALKGKAPDWNRLYARREKYLGTVPKGGIFLTGGADVQEDRIHVEIVSWGRNFESWSIEYSILFGDTASDDVWKKLDSVVCKTWKLSSGVEIGLAKFCIDAGYNTTQVHNWARKYPGSKVCPVIGRDHQQAIISVPIKIDVMNNKKRIAGMKSYPVGSSIVKQELYGFLRQQMPVIEKGEGFPLGFCHFPEYDDEYFKELTAEQLVKKKNKHGYDEYVWEKTRPRNEALDCRVYNRAAACLYGIDRFSEEDWSRLESQLIGAIAFKSESTDTIERVKSEDSFWED